MPIIKIYQNFVLVIVMVEMPRVCLTLFLTVQAEASIL